MTSKRPLIFKAQDGSMWVLPGEIVAHDRAAYYAKDDPDTTYAEEFAYTMKDSYEMDDWLNNNMNYEDFAAYVKPFAPAPPIDLESAWDGDERDLQEIDALEAEHIDFPELPEVQS